MRSSYSFRPLARATLTLALLLSVTSLSYAQEVSPTSVDLGSDSAVCEGEDENVPVSITLPGGSTSTEVDVFLLFDDTGSFASVAPTVTALFPTIISDLESALPGVSFGFGVGRFEDYGGPGASFSGENQTGRPFTLNQPIITSVDAGGDAARDLLIQNALSRTAPGFGGDGPESAIAEGLYQLATGIGFDGNGDGDNTDSGNAGAVGTQTAPGTSGDVPSFSSNVLPTSGTLGGAGFRPGAQKLVILATDVCSIAAFDPDEPLPATITGTGSTEPRTAFQCSSFEGSLRFGFVSDAKNTAGNTVTDAIVPSEAGTVPATIAALNELGVQVIGLGPGASPTSSTSASTNESVFLSALARITGAVDDTGDPLVFSTSATGGISSAIVDAVEIAATSEIDIALQATGLPAGLSFGYSPSVVADVGPGETANFSVTLSGDGSAISGGFDIEFVNQASGRVIGSIPVTVECSSGGDDTTAPVCGPIAFESAGGVYEIVSSATDDVGITRATITRLTSNLDAYVDGAGPFAQGDVLDFAPRAGVDLRARVTSFSGSFAFLVRVEDAAGNAAVCDPVVTEVGGALPEMTALGAAYPNPARGASVRVPFSLAEASAVRVVVYDVLGREVAVLAEGPMEAGRYEVAWPEASRLSPGTYVVRLKAGPSSSTQRITLVR